MRKTADPGSITLTPIKTETMDKEHNDTGFKPENPENNFFLNLDFNFDPRQLSRGKVLISEPFLPDPNFSRSVVLLTEYGPKDGAFGFILNKATDLELGELVDDFPKGKFGFHYGGPVNPENLFFVHTLGRTIDESREILNGLYWAGDFEQVKTLISMGKATPETVKFFGGYSGWSRGQLERELKEKSWIVSHLDVHDIMRGNPENLWKKSLKNLGAQFKIMAGFPENPLWN